MDVSFRKRMPIPAMVLAFAALHLAYTDCDGASSKEEQCGRKTEFLEIKSPKEICVGLKVAAKVLFVKNDRDHRWVNGT